MIVLRIFYFTHKLNQYKGPKTIIFNKFICGPFNQCEYTIASDDFREHNKVIPKGKAEKFIILRIK